MLIGIIVRLQIATLARQGKLNAADCLYRRCVEIHEKALDPDPARLALCLNNRALLLEAQVR